MDMDQYRNTEFDASNKAADDPSKSDRAYELKDELEMMLTIPGAQALVADIGGTLGEAPLAPSEDSVEAVGKTPTLSPTGVAVSATVHSPLTSDVFAAASRAATTIATGARQTAGTGLSVEELCEENKRLREEVERQRLEIEAMRSLPKVDNGMESHGSPVRSTLSTEQPLAAESAFVQAGNAPVAVASRTSQSETTEMQGWSAVVAKTRHDYPGAYPAAAGVAPIAVVRQARVVAAPVPTPMVEPVAAVPVSMSMTPAEEAAVISAKEVKLGTEMNVPWMTRQQQQLPDPTSTEELVTSAATKLDALRRDQLAMVAEAKMAMSQAPVRFISNGGAAPLSPREQPGHATVTTVTANGMFVQSGTHSVPAPGQLLPQYQQQMLSHVGPPRGMPFFVKPPLGAAPAASASSPMVRPPSASNGASPHPKVVPPPSSFPTEPVTMPAQQLGATGGVETPRYCGSPAFAPVARRWAYTPQPQMPPTMVVAAPMGSVIAGSLPMTPGVPTPGVPASLLAMNAAAAWPGAAAAAGQPGAERQQPGFQPMGAGRPLMASARQVPVVQPPAQQVRSTVVSPRK